MAAESFLPMLSRIPWLRFLGLLAMTVWVGGFTFYSAVVIPVLHDVLGSRPTGFVTQRVTNTINAAGVLAVVVWWLIAWRERWTTALNVRRIQSGLLAGTTLILMVLIVLHLVMDNHLARHSFEGFYPLHRIYLIASTAQWFVNNGLLCLLLVGDNHSSGRDDGASPALPAQ